MTQNQIQLMVELIDADHEYRRQLILWYENGKQVKDYPEQRLRWVEVGRGTLYTDHRLYDKLIEQGIAEWADTDRKCIQLKERSNS